MNKTQRTAQEMLQKIIAAYTPLHYSKIDMNKPIKDNYIAAEFKNNFCSDILRYWKNINPTNLRNEMFITLKTGYDILKILNYVIT